MIRGHTHHTPKITSVCIANRIKQVLNKIIHKDQTGFIKGRYIGKNIRIIYDIIYITPQHFIRGCYWLVQQ